MWKVTGKMLRNNHYSTIFPSFVTRFMQCVVCHSCSFPPVHDATNKRLHRDRIDWPNTYSPFGKLVSQQEEQTAHKFLRLLIMESNCNFRSVLEYWNGITERIYRSCDELGEDACLPVYYEQLVLQPVKNTKRIFEFLDIDWCAEVLHHEKHINSTLSK